MATSLKRIYRLISYHSRLFSVRTLKFVSVFFVPRLTFAYDANNVFDGFGAQLHRVLSIVHTAHYFNFQMLQPSILQVTLHPLDPIKTISEMSEFLELCNSAFFDSPRFNRNHTAPENHGSIHISSLNLRTLSFLILRSILFSKPYIIYIKDAHSLADLRVNYYSSIIPIYFDGFLKKYVNREKNQELVIHYRQGAGNFKIYPGQRIPRQISLRNFKQIVLKLCELKFFEASKVRIFTDSPQTRLDFYPPQEQLMLWIDSPGFDGTKVTYEGLDIESEFQTISNNFKIPVSIDRNLNAFEMIVHMANAGFLMTSRSSLSYVAGLLNFQGHIVIAPNFWHPKPSRWFAHDDIRKLS